MTSAVYRYSFTAVPSGVITFFLLLFMVALVFDGRVVPVESADVRISAIFPPKIVPTANPKPDRPTRPPEASQVPPMVKAPPTLLDPGVNTGGEKVVFTPDKTPIQPQLSNSNYIPVYVPQPVFPQKAIRNGVSGYAVVGLTITTTGSVANPSVVEEQPAGYGFGKAALKAAEKLKYSPRVEEGTPVAVPGVMYKFSFSLEE